MSYTLANVLGTEGDTDINETNYEKELEGALNQENQLELAENQGNQYLSDKNQANRLFEDNQTDQLADENQVNSVDQLNDENQADQLSEADLEYLREAFRLFDRKEEGFINPQTLFNGMKALGYHPTEAEIQDLISIVDGEGTGRILFSDFTRTMAKKMTKIATAEDVKEAFRVFDLDGNGLITADDFHNLFVKLGRNRTQGDFEEMIAASDLRGVTGVNLDDMLEILNDDISVIAEGENASRDV